LTKNRALSFLAKSRRPSASGHPSIMVILSLIRYKR
jgi:hypothetical protein